MIIDFHVHVRAPCYGTLTGKPMMRIRNEST